MASPLRAHEGILDPLPLHRPDCGTEYPARSKGGVGNQEMRLLVLQRERADCGTASPVITALC
jgi:hypothetical protein